MREVKVAAGVASKLPPRARCNWTRLTRRAPRSLMSFDHPVLFAHFVPPERYSRPSTTILAVTIFVGQAIIVKPLATATFCAPFTV